MLAWATPSNCGKVLRALYVPTQRGNMLGALVNRLGYGKKRRGLDDPQPSLLTGKAEAEGSETKWRWGAELNIHILR